MEAGDSEDDEEILASRRALVDKAVARAHPVRRNRYDSGDENDIRDAAGAVILKVPTVVKKKKKIRRVISDDEEEGEQGDDGVGASDNIYVDRTSNNDNDD